MTLTVVLLILAFIPDGRAQDEIDLGDLLNTGAQWVQKNLPVELLNQIDLPTPKEWQDFWDRSQKILGSGSLEDAAEMLPYVETAAKLLGRVPGGEDYAAWLQQRLDYFEVANAAIQAVPETVSAAPLSLVTPPSVKGRLSILPPPRRAAPPKIAPTVEGQRLRVASSAQTWKRKLAGRPLPGKIPTLVPQLKEVFKAEGVPTELVWLAEVESAMNPRAKNPSGATGLFQFMPSTALRFGLQTSPLDERQNPEKSARAAARYLKFLYNRFNSWPLALAAYNAGEGLVSALLAQYNASTFEEISPYLPLETRLYVPKVEAVISLREGVNELKLPAPAVARLPYTLEDSAVQSIMDSNDRDSPSRVIRS